MSGWGKSVLAPRTLTRGSRDHLRVSHVCTTRRAPCGTQREKRSVRPLTWDGLAGGARKGLATHGAAASVAEKTPAGFGEPEVVLGDPHSCRNRRTARGPAAPGEQPVKRLDLARCKRANACRKRDLGGKARVLVAAPRVSLSASKGRQSVRFDGGRRFGLGKRRHWRAVCGTGSWFRQKPARPLKVG